MLSFFPLGMLELLPLLDLELSLLAGGPGNLSSITLAVGGEMGIESSSDLTEESEDWEDDLELGPFAVGSSNPFC